MQLKVKENADSISSWMRSHPASHLCTPGWLPLLRSPTPPAPSLGPSLKGPLSVLAHCAHWCCSPLPPLCPLPAGPFPSLPTSWPSCHHPGEGHWPRPPTLPGEAASSVCPHPPPTLDCPSCWVASPFRKGLLEGSDRSGGGGLMSPPHGWGHCCRGSPLGGGQLPPGQATGSLWCGVHGPLAARLHLLSQTPVILSDGQSSSLCAPGSLLPLVQALPPLGHPPLSTLCPACATPSCPATAALTDSRKCSSSAVGFCTMKLCSIWSRASEVWL